MIKVRVTKNMPFSPLGKEFELCHNGTLIFVDTTGPISEYEIEREEVFEWIRKGWLEFVEEEKSLEDKFISDFNKQSNYITHEQRAIKACVTAKEDQKRYYMNKFDEAVEELRLQKKHYYNFLEIMLIRKSMFGDT